MAKFHDLEPRRCEDIISDLQIGVRGRLRVKVLSSEHAHFVKPKARAQYGKLVLVVVLVLQSEGRYWWKLWHPK